MSEDIAEGGLDSRPMTAVEYAKVHAILERIDGLRRSMTATAVVGAAVSCFSFVYTGLHVDSKTGYFALSYTADTLARALLYSIFAFLPFILVLGFFSNHVNMHIDELASGRYERRILLDSVITDHVATGQNASK